MFATKNVAEFEEARRVDESGDDGEREQGRREGSSWLS